MKTVDVELGAHSYKIYVESGTLGTISDYLKRITSTRSCVLIVDRAIQHTHGATVKSSLERSGFNVVECQVTATEEQKTLKTYENLCQTLLDRRVDRGWPLIALGGGITGDIAGFVAATYQRGLPFVQVPTTLLSTVDSSVGGKVAVNLSGSKNMLGAFYQPAFVLIDVNTLHTLPMRELRCGLAECLKHGIISSRELFDWTTAHLAELLDQKNTETREELIARNVGFKASIVQQDEREQGARALLNLGHTFGHAIEGCGGSEKYKHGEAVSIGVVAATHLARTTGLCSDAVFDKVVAAFKSAGLPVRLEMDIHVDVLMAEMRKDKKKRGEGIPLVLPKDIGHCVVVRDVEEQRIVDAWKFVMN